MKHISIVLEGYFCLGAVSFHYRKTQSASHCTQEACSVRECQWSNGRKVQRVKHRVWNNQALLSYVLLLPSRLSLPPPLFGSMARSIVCYLHNCLSPPLVMGEVALSQRYRGNTDWWSRYLSGSTTLSISAHRHDKSQATNCNGLINPLWGKRQNCDYL